MAREPSRYGSLVRYTLQTMLKTILTPLFKKLPDSQKKIVIYYYKLARYAGKNIRGAVLRRSLGSKKIGRLEDFEQRFDSQNGEDGMLAATFRKIGTTDKYCVEFGIHPDEGNSVYLAKHGWQCLWMDGKGDGARVKKEIITADNINALFEKYSVPEEFDLLSIDIDSNDYWVWKALGGYRPRVVVIEYNASVPPTESKTVAYDPALTWDGTNYFGASLLALQKLGAEKGWTLVATDTTGTNAFFIRNDLVAEHFEVRSTEDIYTPPAYGAIENGRHIGHPRSSRSMVSV